MSAKKDKPRYGAGFTLVGSEQKESEGTQGKTPHDSPLFLGKIEI